MIDDITWRFQYHPPKDKATAELHESIRDACLRAAIFVDEMIPDGREKSLALTKIEEAMFWANAAIARRKEVD